MKKLLLISLSVIFSSVLKAQIITTIAGGGGLSSDGIPATNAFLTDLHGITVDNAGNLYIGCMTGLYGPLSKVNSAGIISHVGNNLGAPVPCSGSSVSVATTQFCSAPIGLATDASGNIYIGDSSTCGADKISGLMVAHIAGASCSGYSGYSGDGGPATAALFGLDGISGITADGLGNVFVIDGDNNVIRKINSSGVITTYAGNGSYGNSGDGGPATAASIGVSILYFEQGIATDGTGNLYISGYGGLIRKVDAISGNITTVAGGGVSTADGVPATAANLVGGGGITLDNCGNIYIVCNFNTKIRRIDAATGIITTVAGTGVGGFSGDGGPASAAQIIAYAITCDASGNIYINNADRVRKITAPPVVPPAISGPSAVCVGATISLSDVGSGTWSSSSTGIATINTSGIVTGVSAGTAVISYTLSSSCGSIVSTHAVTVNPLPSTPSAISGPSSVCVGLTVSLSDATPGGAWSSGSTGIATVGSTGIVSGVSSGTAVVSYTISNACGSAYVTTAVTVNPLPATPSAISGPPSVCAGSTVSLSDATPGGGWSSGSTGIATVGSTGIVCGVSSGTAVISYTISNACGSAYATATVTVNPHPAIPSAISGPSSVCPGSTISLSDATPGGAWSSGSTGIATVGSTGIVSGVSSGMAVISYTISNACGSAYATTAVTVNPLPATPSAISGPSSVCAGSMISLSDATPGGAWTSSTTGAATIGSTGLVSGIAAGTSIISYTVSNTCGSAAATLTITVHVLPSISGASSHTACGSFINLSASGGVSYTWLPSSGLTCSTCGTTTANISTTTIYTVTGTDAFGCSKSATVNVNANRIFGHISLSGSLTSLKVWLIQYNPSDSSLYALDSTLTCLDAGTPYYEFDGKTVGNYMVKAEVIGSTPGTSGYVPTYGLSTPYWDTASVVMHMGNTDTIHINMIHGTVPSGPGFISGYIYSGAGKGTTGEVPVQGMLVFLKDVSNHVLTYTYTDALGAYTFGALAYGDYVIYPEDYNYYTTPSATVTLDAAHATVNNVNFKQHTDFGTITPFDGSTGISAITFDRTLNIYPNPSTGEFTLQLQEQDISNIDVAVMDMTGRVIYAERGISVPANGMKKIYMPEASTGLYMAIVKTSKSTFIKKITVQK